jgi:D-amino-acid oxidase
MDSVDCLVIGAGVIGLATARELARAGHETLIVERHSGFGTETSSRNSEVIHAGLHYPEGSLKATLCVRGCELLYRYSRERGIAHRRCGKLIVATGTEQQAGLDDLAQAAQRNGVTDLRLLDRDDVLRLEPALQCEAALFSPSTGILDSHAFMLALLGDAEDCGARLAVSTAVSALRPRPGGIEVCVDGAEQPLLNARCLVNAAGLQAPALARRIEGLASDQVPPAWFARGNYFSCSGRVPFGHLIYPLPEPGGLGVHLSLDLNGQGRFGPDVEWVDVAPEAGFDYRVDPARAARFYPAIRRWWPALRDGQLQPAYSGIRPKLSGPGQPAADFRIDGPASHGIDGLVNLFGIESPGLTASLAIAEQVAALLAAA